MLEFQCGNSQKPMIHERVSCEKGGIGFESNLVDPIPPFKPWSDELADVFHQAHSNVVSCCLKITFGINANDRFGIGCTQVYPIGIKLNLQTIFCIDRVIFVFLFDLFKNGFDIQVFCNSILFLEIK
jgi:hypothetical protein